MTPRPGLTVLVLACGLLLLPPAAPAQEQTGSIQGTVKDSTGGVLRGATVEARSPTVVGVNRAVTDDRGSYRFPALPPATYTVTAELAQFAPARVENAVVMLGQLLTINLTLSVGGITADVLFTSESPALDVRQSASYATVDTKVLNSVLIGRDYTQVIPLAPGARAEAKAGGYQIDGASGSENRFIIDGMDTTNLQIGVSGKTLLSDFVQEVQIKSSGYNAEFGGAVGGVVNAITRSGSNQMRGSAGVYYQNDGFYGDIRPTHGYNTWDQSVAEGAENVPNCGGLNRPCSTGVPLTPFRIPWTYVSPIFDLGGPIRKDRIWYYGGMGYTRNSYHQDTVFITDPTYTKRRFDWSTSTYYPVLNVTSQIASGLRLRVSAMGQSTTAKGTAPAMLPQGRVYLGADKNLYGKDMSGYSASTFDKFADGTINQEAFDRRWTNYGTTARNNVVVGNVDWVVTPKVFVNATAGYYYTNNWTSPAMRGDNLVHIISTLMSDAWMTGRGYPTVPAAYQQPNGFTDNISSNGTARNILDRLNLSANVTWTASWRGLHTFKAGVQFDRRGNDLQNGNLKPRINFYWGSPYQASDGRVLSGRYGYYIVSQSGAIADMHTNDTGLYVQDSWSIGPKLTVNAGLRIENEVIPSYKDAPDAIDVKFGFGDKIAPRLGFAYDLKGDGRWKLYGSAGYFYDLTKLEMPRGTFGSSHWVNYIWTLDTYDWASINCGEGTTGCPGTLLETLDLSVSSNQPSPVLAAHFSNPGMTGIDPALKPMKSGEVTVGIDRELGPRTTLGARYVHKWLSRTIEDVGIYVPGYGEVYLVGNPGFGYTRVMEPDWPTYVTPTATRDYDAVEVRFWRRLSKGLAGQINYTWSRLWGNYGGLASSDENGRTSPNVNRYFDSPYMSYDKNNQVVKGLLGSDRPHFLNVYGVYEFSFGTSVGVAFSLGSGTPESTTFVYKGYPVYLNGRGDMGRYPAISQLDLQLGHEFRLGGSRRLVVQAIVLNLFDQKAVNAYFSTSAYRGSVVPANDNMFFGGPWQAQQMVDVAKSQGAIIYDQIWFKTPNGYQAPREARLAVKFSF